MLPLFNNTTLLSLLILSSPLFPPRNSVMWLHNSAFSPPLTPSSSDTASEPESARNSLRTALVGPSQLLQASTNRMALMRVSSSARKPSTFSVAGGSGGQHAAAAADNNHLGEPIPLVVPEGDEEEGGQGSFVLKDSPFFLQLGSSEPGASSLPEPAAAAAATAAESASHHRRVGTPIALPALTVTSTQPGQSLMDVVAQAMRAAGKESRAGGHALSGHTSEALNPLHNLVSVPG